MQKVLTAAEMKEVDRLTAEEYGIPPQILMESAAHRAACVISERLGGSVDGRSVLILCGKGNNGGDGAALARILWTHGADVEVCLFGLVENTKDHARTNFEILQKITESESFDPDCPDLAFEEITSLEAWLDYDSLNFHCDDPDVIVDALLGTGLKRPLDGVYEQAAGYIHAFNADGMSEATLIVSLDLPSGLDADRCDHIGMTPKAHVTVTFTAPKAANLLPPASHFNGEIVVANIGSPKDLVDSSPSQLFRSDKCDAARWMEATCFSENSYKNKRGHALLIAGSDHYSGAAVLCGNATIRSGAGLATIVTAKSARDAIASRAFPEVMVRGAADTPFGALSEDAFEEIERFWQNSDVVAIGSGLSSSDDSTKNLVRKVLEHRRTPVIIDADGLNCLSPFEIVGSTEFPLILTPHDGEFVRLLGNEGKEALKDRVQAARSFAEKHKVILVLKGERALIADADGRVVINPTGNSGLGKAGNGDTLTGIITGFVAQAAQMKVDIFETVVAAVYIAGLAGDIAETKCGKRVMTATAVMDCLGDAFEAVNE